MCISAQALSYNLLIKKLRMIRKQNSSKMFLKSRQNVIFHRVIAFQEIQMFTSSKYLSRLKTYFKPN